MKNGQYLKIQGINHHRFVGIAKDSGKAYDYYFANKGGYRMPKSADEMLDCQNVALAYYRECEKWGTATGEFGLAVVVYRDEEA